MRGAARWIVMAGLVRPSTSSLVHAPKTWMPATSTGMTPENVMVTAKTNPFVPAQAGTQTQNTLGPRLRENKRRLAQRRERLRVGAMALRLLRRARGDGRDRVLGAAARFRHRVRCIAGEGLRRLLHAQAEFLGLVRQGLRLPGQKLALTLRELLRFLHACQLLPVLHRVRPRLLSHVAGLLANRRTLALEIVRHLAGDSHQRVERSLTLGETFLSELSAPGKSESGCLHCALAGLLRKFRVPSHSNLLPFHRVDVVHVYLLTCVE